MKIEQLVKVLQRFPQKMDISIFDDKLNEILYQIEEIIISENVLYKLPENLRIWYEPQFGAGVGNKYGQFLGLSCKVCRVWIQYTHDKNCPVSKIK